MHNHHFKNNNLPVSVKVKEYPFDGDHASHGLASSITERLVDIRDKHLRSIFSSYEGVDHRLEYVACIRDVLFIDDAAACTPLSTWYSIERMNRPITWLTMLKNVDTLTDDLLDAINQKVNKIVLQGIYQAEVIDMLSFLGKEMSMALQMEDAVRAAFYASVPGDVVLFSPGEVGSSHFRTIGKQYRHGISQL
ncbi:MAG: hypothetical protein LBR51_02535 [Bacteroidales bacterium]|jgi:UDP-N-acetylmuramoylalanine--D-glutamate ligase|nr:hypothetical protein [Bacteroidales bacterium]